MSSPITSHSQNKYLEASPNREISLATKWIWAAGEEAPVNAFIDFQGAFQLGQISSLVHVLISADSRYRLHVNGHPVGIGPARNYPGHYEFDRHDITPLLKAGRNVLDVRVHHWGEGTFHGLVLRAGLICEVQSEEGVLLSSSRSWRAKPAAAYQFPTPRIACQLGFEEQVDLALEQGALSGRIASGKGWGAAVEIGPVGVKPWGPLTLRTIPLLGGATVSPVSVRECGEMTSGELVLPLRAGPDLGCDWKVANSEQVDGIFAARFFANHGGALRVRRSAMYGGPIRVFVDGCELALQQGRFDLEGEIALRRGDHLLLVDWKGTTHDADVGISLSGIEGLQLRSFDEFPHAHWVFARPGKLRAKIRQASSPRGLMNCGVAWSAVSPSHAPKHDVYMALSTRELARDVQPVESVLPFRIAAQTTDHPQRIVLDFGAHCFGWIEMEMIAVKGAVVELMGIEASGDAGPQLTEMTNNTARIVCRQGKQTFQSFVARGFRYLILDIVAQQGAFELLSARVREETYPWKPQGRFLCSDARLNQIQQMCAHTLRMSSMDVFVDATYEQTLWVGDTCSMLIPLHYYLQGENRLPERCLRLIALSLERTPLVNSQVPSSWEDRLIPNWSFFWVSGVRSNYEYSGNLSFVRELLPALFKQAQYVAKCLDKDGLFALHERVWHFLDWNGTADDHRKNQKAVYCHENCLALASLQDTAWLASQAGDSKMASHCEALAHSLREAIRNCFWLPGQKAFGETRVEGKTSPLVTSSTQICALRAGLFSNPSEIACKVLAPKSGMVPTGTPWMWSLGAWEACLHDSASDVYQGISSHWGRMLDRGATSAWEMFEGRHRPGLPTRSWCHGWSAGPAWVLPAFALGVRPTSPGWKSVVIDPQPGHLLWAEGTVPTPHGNISVNWEMRGGKCHVEYEAPSEISVVVGRAS
jgi:hypothetical protein